MQRPIGEQLRALRTRISNARRVALGLEERPGGGLTQQEVSSLLERLVRERRLNPRRVVTRSALSQHELGVTCPDRELLPLLLDIYGVSDPVVRNLIYEAPQSAPSVQVAAG
jgi:hypothetical protein